MIYLLQKKMFTTQKLKTFVLLDDFKMQHPSYWKKWKMIHFVRKKCGKKIMLKSKFFTTILIQNRSHCKNQIIHKIAIFVISAVKEKNLWNFHHLWLRLYYLYVTLFIIFIWNTVDN